MEEWGRRVKMLKRNFTEEKKESLSTLSIWPTWETISRNTLLDSEEFSLHQRWAQEDLGHLHGARNRRCAAGSFCERQCWPRSRHCRREPWKWPQDEREKSYKGLWNRRCRTWSSERHSLEWDKQKHATHIKESIKVKGKGKVKVDVGQHIFIHFLYADSQQHWREFMLQ